MHELFLLLMCPAYALTTDPNFAVTGCNDADNIPEMTLRIKKQYFVDNLSWQTGFTLNDDDTAYEKKIPEDQLLIDLSDQCKFFDQLWTGIPSMVPRNSDLNYTRIIRAYLSSYFSSVAEFLSKYNSISPKT